MTTTLRTLGASLRLLVLLTLVLGVAYPLAVWGVAQVALSGKADGSQVKVDGAVVGSSLIGQTFDGPGWFQPRPSAAGDGYDTLSSGASNLGPTNRDLLADVEERRAKAAADNRVAPSSVPPDALTASGSGLDPHISPEYARLQVARVARERGLPEAAVAQLVEDHVEGRLLGFIGEPRVNVLELNVALNALTP
jgi:potassium-transporting ATPase KdpC subunit